MLVFLLAFSTNTLAQEEGDVKAGEALYKSNCAACHKLDKKGVGPALRNVAEKIRYKCQFQKYKQSVSE